MVRTPLTPREREHGERVGALLRGAGGAAAPCIRCLPAPSNAAVVVNVWRYGCAALLITDGAVAPAMPTWLMWGFGPVAATAVGRCSTAFTGSAAAASRRRPGEVR
ncbi:hypothetical protein [Streptomyces sp. NPDC048665]|uniref:hypothetical protein n=1 Tax=Streptomyces sp. NPDC048665 TaxID=3155490 RepID=UPI003427D0D2